MPVTTKHKDYTAAEQKWILPRAASNGLDGDTAHAFLIPRQSERTQSGQTDSGKMKLRAAKGIYTNYTGRTRDGLAGAVFRIAPKFELPSGVEHLEFDAEGTGVTLESVAKRAFSEILEAGGIGFLAEFPDTEGVVPTLEQVRNLNLVPYLSIWPVESVLNYEYAKVGGRRQLVRLVLKQERPEAEPDDEFNPGSEPEYLVLRLQDGVYTQQRYGKDEKPKGEPIVIRDGKGLPFDHIPFAFARAQGTSVKHDAPVLYDIAVVNIGHFRNSCDHEDNLTVYAGATLVIATDMDNEQFKAANPSGILVGANNGILLSKDSRAELLQINAASAVSEEMVKKEERLRQIGAKMIIKGSSINQTAEAARLDASSESSVVDDIVGNIDSAMLSALKDCCLFGKADPEKVSFELNRDYWFDKLDPQLALALIQLSDINVVTKTAIARYLQDCDINDKNLTPEQIIQQAEAESVL